MLPSPSQITHLLSRWSDGDSEALDQLIPLVYERMRQLAHQRRGIAPDGSLNTTALVHEAYLKLARSPQARVRDQSHFLALASRVMRQLLVDRARARNTTKRGGDVSPFALDETGWIADEDLGAASELDDALKRLEAIDARQSRILEQRYFGGLSLEETASALGVSLATVKRELRSARAWLAADLEDSSS
jgi:RNA polymerase sigma factor (TIGR02999 family)